MFFRTKLLLAAAVLSGLIICLVGPAAAVTVWNAADDFSAINNPNPPWSSGYEASGAGPLTLFSVPSWTKPNNNAGAPAFWKANGTVFLHPGSDSATALAVARWTSPLSGTVNVSGYFGQRDFGVMYYYIYVDANPIPIWSFTSGGNGPFSFSQSVIDGTIIDFAVGVGPATFMGGTTLLDATITAVPLPGALWLLGSGLLGLAGLRRKFKS